MINFYLISFHLLIFLREHNATMHAARNYVFFCPSLLDQEFTSQCCVHGKVGFSFSCSRISPDSDMFACSLLGHAHARHLQALV